ncbi:mitochondrial intermediate peptidase [Trifolium repens]|nr:mitochondrial intermediate peptidase [Trifolium repens]
MILKLFFLFKGDWRFIYLDIFERRETVPVGSMLHRLRHCLMISPTQYQIPVVIIVCDFLLSLDEKLFHSDVKELFHEFGHALHCLLSRTDRSLVHGTQLVFGLLEIL